MRSALPLMCALALAAAGCGGGGSTTTVTVTHTVSVTKTVTAPVTTGSTQEASTVCLASALTGTFSVVAGSAGAGQISYRLRLVNQSDSPCFVSGLPVVQLLDKDGGKLPTNSGPAHPGTATAVRVDLKPGDAATSDARFSPDVPGTGDDTGPQCEPKAVTLRVTVGDGTVDAPFQPPTPVCERGSLFFDNYTAAS